MRGAIGEVEGMKNRKRSARWAEIAPRLRYGGMSTLLVALVIAALLLVNLAMTRLEKKNGWRGDFSFNTVTTQSETTKQILADLTRPVKIYALFERGQEDAPLLELLDRYAAESDLVTWEQTPPSLNPTLLTRFSTSTDNVSVQDLIVYCEETDRYRVLSMQDFITLSVDTDSGSYSVSGLAYEQKITSAIAYVTRDRVPTMHVSTGHGELEEDTLSAFVTLLTENHYDVAFETLSQMDLQQGDTLCILSPILDFTEEDMTIIKAFIQSGGSVLFTCDFSDPVDDMPNYQALLRSYGFLPKEGVIAAAEEESDTYYNNRLFLRPEIQATDVTLDMMLDGRTSLLMIYSRGFEANPEADNSLLVDAVLTTSENSYLISTSSTLSSLEKQPGAETGPFALALEARRFSDTGDVSRAFVLGSSALLTEEQLYTMTDSEEFLMRMVEFLADVEAVDSSIMVKTALRPSLSMDAGAVGSLVLVLLPMLVLLAAVLILLPRRHL